ncbi:winged helix-turn-helix transcriptional regulator [Marinicella litoralis]|uniref:HxlR family transcriptional regulator n=1 Tax=Marinicella litoralis TaxID=644220 RepID=A0A4R6X6L0_9GAMM|nr:helix-turn-helix domain-containing protein [Marinicella litoralis]TDR14636.1 HxlR family transcriptional regulator [Marinicella litoralis]
MKYGQFCPVAKTAEILGEKWTILIIRELLMGATRFNQIQRGLNLISPTLLSSRLDKLEDLGLVIKKKSPALKGHEYFSTKSCRDLLPIIKMMGEWGMLWTFSNVTNKDYDMELLMLYLERSVATDHLPDGETTIKFKFVDLQQNANWWIVVQDGKKDLCIKDPGKEVDVYITTDVKTMIDVWMGEASYRAAEKNGEMKIIGHKLLTQKINSWLKDSVFKGLPTASNI